jgi:hypothetical protein
MPAWNRKQPTDRSVSQSRLMARVTQIDPIDQVAGRIDDTPEPAETVSSNPDNIDHGEMI